MLKVYTTPTCIYCHALMNWLEDENIDFEEVDASDMAEITSVPVTEVCDKKGKVIAKVIGFDRPAIKKALEKLK